MVTKSLVEVPLSVHGLIFIESVRGPFKNISKLRKLAMISAILRHCQFDNCKIALIALTNVDFQISNISKLRKLAKYSAICTQNEYSSWL